MTQFVKPFAKSTYKKRRERLALEVSKSVKGDFVILLWSGSELVRNFDCHFPFRATSDFLYFTGFSEPETLALVISRRGKIESLIGLRPRDLSPNRGSELWEGERVGVERATSHLGFDSAFNIHEALTILERELSHAGTVLWTLSQFREWDEKILQVLAKVDAKSRGLSPIRGILDPRPAMHSLRLQKSKEEIDVMRLSATIGSAGHIRAMRVTRPGMFEYQVAAEIEREFKKRGAQCPSYNSIVGGGNNACTLHYHANSAELRKGDLLLIDAGSEYHGYASDITRTFPVSPHFSPAQKEVYSWVLKSQVASIASVRPGSNFEQAQKAAVRILCRGLSSMGFFRTSAESVYKKGLWKKYMPHGIGHWLGLDVHDAGPYRDPKNPDKPIAFKAGNIVTIEPGLYIPSNDKSAPKAYRGIGIRIEDDVLVTSSGYDVLTKMCPKSIEEVEALRAEKL